MRAAWLLATSTVLAGCGDSAATTASSAEGGSTSSGAGGSAGSDVALASSGTTSVGASSSSTGTPNPDDPYGCFTGPIPPRPASIPEGWRPWGCWDQKPQCLLWIPEDPETMVAPMEWGPCFEGAAGGDGCQQMKITWPFASYGAIGATYPAVPELDSKAGGKLMRLARSSIRGDAPDDSYTEWIVSEPDGPVRFAMRQPWFGELPACGYQDYDLNEGFWILGAVGDDNTPISETPHHGSVLIDPGVGKITLLSRNTELGGSAGWQAGASWVVRDTASQLHVHDHAFASDLVIHDAGTDPEGAGPSSIVDVVGDQVIWQVATSQTVGIRAYDPDLGTHDLIRYLDDPTRGASTPGTDGVDLVWMEGNAWAADKFTYAIRDMMTSPFTTDPAALEPKRLRSDLSTSFGTDGSAFRVNCGRAAKSGGASTHDIQIVRLSDGQGWNILHHEGVWNAGSVVGLTCDEIFFVVTILGHGEGSGNTIQRIRFDALGEGIPAD